MMTVRGYMNIAIVAVVVGAVGLLSLKSCSSGKESVTDAAIAETAQTVRDSVDISNETSKGVNVDEQQVRESVYQARAAFASAKAANPAAGGVSSVDGRDAGIVRIIQDAYESARRADCRLLGEGPGCETGAAPAGKH